MVDFVIGALTVVLVLNCLFLILLILVQLPKKEAGIGMAFGGAATETLFGAGSGTVLTRATKYSAGLFMGLALLLAIMNSTVTRKQGAQLEEELQRLAATGAGPTISAPAATTNAAPPISTTPSPAPASTQAPTATSSSMLLSDTNTGLLLNSPEPTPPVPATNTPPAE